MSQGPGLSDTSLGPRDDSSVTGALTATARPWDPVLRWAWPVPQPRSWTNKERCILNRCAVLYFTVPHGHLLYTLISFAILEDMSSNNNLLSLAGWYFLPNVSALTPMFKKEAQHQRYLMNGNVDILARCRPCLVHFPSFNASIIGPDFYAQLVTGWVQTAYYAVWIRAGDPKPQPGSRAFVSHRKRIHILVILAYLLYTIYEADWQLRQSGDFYQHLGVSHYVEDRGLQSRFRRL